jgi:hypothetical protein
MHSLSGSKDHKILETSLVRIPLSFSFQPRTCCATQKCIHRCPHDSIGELLSNVPRSQGRLDDAKGPEGREIGLGIGYTGLREGRKRRGFEGWV